MCEKNLKTHSIEIFPQSERLDFSVRYSLEEITSVQKPQKIFQNGAIYWNNFWEKGGIIQLNQSQDKRAIELERRIILSQYLMAVNSSGSIPPQETGLTCNSWYGKMHLEMYLWHCGWLAHWNYGEMTERSLLWYKNHLHIAKKNAAFNGYKGARWPKMVGMEGIDCPSPIAPLLVWQQPHIIYMLEMVYRQNPRKSFLKAYWDVLKETVEFMVDYVVWNDVTGCYDICAPVIPVQERHQPEDTHNPAFEIEYWHFTLNIGCQWAERLEKQIDEKWCHVSEHMATLTEKEGVYLAHENCTETFEKVNIDHPSMLGAFGLIHSRRINKKVMEKTLQRVVEGWEYPTLWGWDFAMMAMTAVRLGKPELAIDILLKDTPKNCYLSNGHNMQISRKDLPLYLPGNGSLLFVAAMMIAGFDGAEKKYPGFPDNGKWVVEYENIIPFI